MSKRSVSGRKRANRDRRYNRIAMFGISLVVSLMLVMLLVGGYSVRQRIAKNEVKQERFAQQIQEEKERTKEIEELQEYMQSDEYTEKIAKEKIGLVKENEIIFKEAD